MSPLAPLVAGLVGLAVGALILRSYGSNYRVGRLLASAPAVSVAEARALAGSRPSYVAIEGRIDSELDFEDAAHRPLVFRRTRLQVSRAGTWTDLDDHRERVPFDIREGGNSIAVDDAALDEGLVVVVRESDGVAADVADRLPANTPLDAPARLRIEQISLVEHAIVVGVPRLGEQGAPTISAGLGRPLILTTLERPEAMRILAHGDSRRPMVAVASLIGGFVLICVGLAWVLIGALA